jgi:hypothetical protein
MAVAAVTVVQAVDGIWYLGPYADEKRGNRLGGFKVMGKARRSMEMQRA